MDGKSMRYAKTEQGRYKLWSLGFDGHDDGGDLRPHPSGNDEPLMWDKNYPGDWVWSYEPLVPAKP